MLLAAMGQLGIDYPVGISLTGAVFGDGAANAVNAFALAARLPFAVAQDEYMCVSEE
jgi:hypothetical protein